MAKVEAMASPRASPFPSQQLFVLALCRICEPIAFMSIFPYVYQMILSFGVSASPSTIAVYVGLVTSSFAFAEFSSGVLWGRLSDRVGRKPVLLCGLLGTAISMTVFGFAPNLIVALLGRAIGGLLNGNLGVLQTTVAELVTEKAHQPRAYSIMPFVWCLGSIIGPALGGALAQPAKSYPHWFPPHSLFDRHAFLLPNLVCSAILCLGVIVGVLFLDETHQLHRQRRDLGRELGHTLALHWKVLTDGRDARLPDCTTIDREKYAPLATSSNAEPGPNVGAGAEAAFTQQVILVIAAFGILAYHSISFDQLMPIFLSEPVARPEARLPLYFVGGFGLSTQRIGFIMSIQGLYSMFAQVFLFPFAARRFGVLRTFRSVLLVWPFLYLIVPYLVLLPIPLQQPAIYCALLTKITLHVLAFPSTAILLTNAAPSLLVLGVINGVSASTASLARACGPTLTGILHSWGLHHGCSGLAWWASGLVCIIGAVESFYLKEGPIYT